MDRDQLIIDHQIVARRAATQFWNRGGMRLDRDDVQGEAALCLVKAAHVWDESRVAAALLREGAQSRFAPFLIRRIKWHLMVWADEQRGGHYHCNRVRNGLAEPFVEVGLLIPRGDRDDLRIDPPDHHPTAERRLVDGWRDELMGKWMDSAPRREAKIMKLRLSGKNRAEVARAIGIYPERVYRIEIEAARAMRNCSEMVTTKAKSAAR